MNPSDKYVTFNTILPAFKVSILKKIIADKTKTLSKLRYGQPEEALWIMDELNHLRKLLEFNNFMVNCPCKVSLPKL